jgi:hypothetical protein
MSNGRLYVVKMSAEIAVRIKGFTYIFAMAALLAP